MGRFHHFFKKRTAGKKGELAGFENRFKLHLLELFFSDTPQPHAPEELRLHVEVVEKFLVCRNLRYEQKSIV